jgi:hypothetical protein
MTKMPNGDPTRTLARGHGYVLIVTGFAGVFMLTTGVWALFAPRSFADFVDFPYDEHFEHDIGAFLIGSGITLVLALRLRDALTVALAGFLIGNTVHAVNHAIDLDVGGSTIDWIGLATLSLVTAVALGLRLAQSRHAGCRPDQRRPLASESSAHT